MNSAAPKLDPTIYPDTDDMGEGELQQLIDEQFRPELARYLGLRGIEAHVGSNTFIYYRQFDSSKRIAPDIYVLPGIPQSRIGRSWKLWEIGVVPAFALEVVSLDVDKDYIDAPAIHSAIGTRELVVFDPEGHTRSGGWVWQVFRRVRGALRLVERTSADRVTSRELGCVLRVVGEGDAQRIRVATGKRGERLFPTEVEVERAEKERERAEKERERAEKERERAEKEREREARRAADAQNATLRRQLRRLRARSRK